MSQTIQDMGNIIIKQKDQIINRRKFIKQTVSSLGLFFIVPRHVLGGQGFTPPSDQLTKAVIGVGNMGQWHMNNTGSRLLAICDVDDSHLKEALSLVDSEVKGYQDFREVLQRKDIDIVHIATPPHWHGLIAVASAEAGKDIWCEKPMTRTIGEGLKVVEAIRQYGRVFRINTWFRFRGEFYGLKTPVKPIKKLVNSGILGWPLRVTIGPDTGFDWKFEWNGKTNLEPEWIPPNLNYNLWLGPASFKPFNSHRVHQTFRGYWDYDGGGLGDMGQHYLDPVQYILGKDHTSPVEIEASAPQQHPDAVGSWHRIQLTYADGCEIVLEGKSKNEETPFLEGPGGKLYKGFRSDIHHLKEELALFPDPEPQLTDFNKAVKTRLKFTLNEENGHRSTTLINLAKIAVRLRRKLTFNPDKQRFINDDEANRLIHPPMRAPWHL